MALLLLPLCCQTWPNLSRKFHERPLFVSHTADCRWRQGHPSYAYPIFAHTPISILYLVRHNSFLSSIFLWFLCCFSGAYLLLASMLIIFSRMPLNRLSLTIVCARSATCNVSKDTSLVLPSSPFRSLVPQPFSETLAAATFTGITWKRTTVFLGSTTDSSLIRRARATGPAALLPSSTTHVAAVSFATSSASVVLLSSAAFCHLYWLLPLLLLSPLQWLALVFGLFQVLLLTHLVSFCLAVLPFSGSASFPTIDGHLFKFIIHPIYYFYTRPLWASFSYWRDSPYCN